MKKYILQKKKEKKRNSGKKSKSHFPLLTPSFDEKRFTQFAGTITLLNVDRQLSSYMSAQKICHLTILYHPPYNFKYYTSSHVAPQL